MKLNICVPAMPAAMSVTTATPSFFSDNATPRPIPAPIRPLITAAKLPNGTNLRGRLRLVAAEERPAGFRELELVHLRSGGFRIRERVGSTWRLFRIGASSGQTVSLKKMLRGPSRASRSFWTIFGNETVRVL